MELEKKVRLLCKDKYLKTSTEQRVIDILKAIVIDKQISLKNIEISTNIFRLSIKKYLNNKEIFLKVLTPEEYDQFVSYFETLKIEEAKKEENDKYSLCQNIILDILESRFNLLDISTKNYADVKVIHKLLSDNSYLEENFGKDTIDKVKFRIEETASIRSHVPKNKIVIEEPWDLKVVKDKIYYLDRYEYKVLRVMSNYLMSSANIDFVSQQLGIPVRMVYNYINDSKVIDLLKEEYCVKLKKYIKIEEILRTGSMLLKKELIINIVSILREYNYLIDEVIEKIDIPYYLLERILDYKLLVLFLSDDEISQIMSMFKLKETNEKNNNRSVL